MIRLTPAQEQTLWSVLNNSDGSTVIHIVEGVLLVNNRVLRADGTWGS